MTATDTTTRHALLTRLVNREVERGTTNNPDHFAGSVLMRVDDLERYGVHGPNRISAEIPAAKEAWERHGKKDGQAWNSRAWLCALEILEAQRREGQAP